jgi:hypothetical protein
LEGLLLTISTPGIVSRMDDPASTVSGIELAAWLPGEWTVTRVINHGAGHFNGRARFTPDLACPATLIWHEHGRLRLGAHEGPAERTLRIESAAAGAWEVRFADGRPFHPLDLATGSDDVTHLCGEDTYHGRYAVEGPDRFTVTWRASGPRKDDLIETRYDRAA